MRVADSGTPLLGICLGLQLLFERERRESPGVEGLGILKGEIKRIPDETGTEGATYRMEFPASRNIMADCFMNIPEDTVMYILYILII